MNGKTERDLSETVRRILWEDWDPIGVRHIPAAAGEYDAYVSKVCRLIEAHATETMILEYLWAVETERMALDGNRARTALVAAKLHRISLDK
jgi:hypothetical protein